MAAFNPWRWLREHPHISLRWARLPVGVRGLYIDAAEPVIVLDSSLGRRQRNATLCHEVVHAERGISGEPRLDERGVDDEVARLLVPFDELAAMHEIAVLNDLPMEPWQIAEHFDVPGDVAERAMQLLLKSNAA